MDLISVIVPVYNQERYLEECLQSIQHQTYEHIEVILINDGSTDSSGCICKELCKRDSRFQLYTQSNKGLGEARNTGLRKAMGEYICFVDSDDRIEDTYVEKLYQALISGRADIAMCDYVKDSEYIGNYNPLNEQQKVNVLNKMDMLRDISTTGPGNRGEKYIVTWNKLFRKEIFNQLWFPEYLHEDEFMIQDYILRASQIVWTSDKLYFYRQHNESIMGSGNQTNLAHLDLLKAVKSRIAAFSAPEYEEVAGSIVKSYFENAIICMYQLKDRYSFGKLMLCIYPQYLLVLYQNRKKLKRSTKRKYLKFLLSPKKYWKKYWGVS